jgi:hypothetical protein
VGELQSAMTQAEFLAWVQFYRLYPFDDYHRYYRPAALVSQSMGGGDVKERLDWLQPDPTYSGYSEAEVRSFKAHGITPPPRH